MNKIPKWLQWWPLTTPERRWWGLNWIPFIGLAVGSWFWTVEGKMVIGWIVFIGSIVLAAALFHFFVKQR